MSRDEVFKQMEELDAAHPTPASRSGQFFHGTTHNVADGVVRPANVVDKYASEHSMGDPGDMSEGDHAFAIRNHEGYAWHAAGTFHKNGRRPRVYEVEPANDMKPGPWNKEHPDFELHHDYDPGTMPEDEKAKEHQDEWASPTGFNVKKRIDIMPGRQGTFPEVNWNRFKQDGPRYGPDANHPSDDQIKHGMVGLEETHKAALSEHQFGHNWKADSAPHSPLREAAGRPQKRWATLFD